MACLLAEAQKTVLDHVIAMHDQLVTALCRRSRNAFEAQHREFRRRAKRGLDTLLAAVEILLDPQRPREAILGELERQIDRDTLREARDSCREFQRLEERGYVDELCARYPHLRRYLPAFFALPWQGGPGAGPLLVGLSLVRALDAGERPALPADAPLAFVPAAWRPALYLDDGTIHRRVWEIALGLAIRDALRCGELFLPESRRHVSFWNLLYDDRRWDQERDRAYVELALPREVDQILGRLTQEFETVARQADQGLDRNPFAALRDGRLHLKRPDALEIPERVQELRRVLETHLPRVRIEDLLQDVDAWCGFLQAFRPLGGYQAREGDRGAALPAALIAHGTNLGIAAMGHSAEGITVDMLRHVTQWFLREETLKAANTALVDYHHRLGLSSVWGDGTSSSSDGQRFGVQAGSLLGALYPRYFGYYDRAVTVYTHTSDQYSVFGTRAISCSAREAVYVLDGLLENDTVLGPREHSTDTHGYTEHLFGLCYLLGYSFMPRLRGLADQQLYKTRSEHLVRSPGAAVPRRDRYGPDPRAVGSAGPGCLVVAAPDRTGARCRATAGGQFALGSPGQGPDGVGSGRQDDLLVALPPRRGAAPPGATAVEPGRVAARAGAVAVLRQPGRVPHGRLRGDDEQGQLPEPALERGAGLEYRTAGGDRRTAACRRRVGLG